MPDTNISSNSQNSHHSESPATDSKVFKELPKVHTTYANIIKSLLPVGDKPKVSKEQLPSVRYQVDSLSLDKNNLDDYRKICGFYNTGNVPITYYAVLSQALQMNMMAKEAFPFAMLGLVHVENQVTQYRPIGEDEVVNLSVELDNLRDHDKGQQFDFVTKVSKDGKLIWEGISTYLSRVKSTANASTSKKSVDKQTNDALMRDNTTTKVFAVPEDIGRRYAFVSGDFNLIHIHPLSAKAFGFPKAIAHGMWTKAKCLAQINDLPTAYSVNVSFKLPILLPAEVELVTQKFSNDAKERQFALYSAKNGKPHLLGIITPVESVK